MAKKAEPKDAGKPAAEPDAAATTVAGWEDLLQKVAARDQANGRPNGEPSPDEADASLDETLVADSAEPSPEDDAGGAEAHEDQDAEREAEPADEADEGGERAAAAASEPDTEADEAEPDEDLEDLKARVAVQDRELSELRDLKGRLGSEMGELRAALEKFRSGGAEGESEEEQKAQIDRDIARLMEVGPRHFMAELAQEAQQTASERLHAHRVEQAPRLAFERVSRRYKDFIGGDPEKWAQGPQGQGVRQAIESDPIRLGAWNYYRAQGNHEGLATVLREAFDQVIAKGKAAATAMGKREARRVHDERKPRATAGTPTRRPEAGLKIKSPADWPKLLEFVRRREAARF